MTGKGRGPRVGTTLAEALDAAGAGHRRTVARAVGLPADAAAEQIAAAVVSPAGIADRLAAFEPTALETLAFGALTHGVVAIDHRGHRSGFPDPSPTILSLAAGGLLCSTRTHHQTMHQIHPELGRPLRVALFDRAATVALTIDRQAPEGLRWVTAPEQTLHDAAALSARLAAGGIQVKADGELYAKAVPKLVEALPALGVRLDPPASALRLDLTLELLRDGGFVRCRSEDRPGASKRQELVTTGDLHARLRSRGDDLTGLVAAVAMRRIGVEIAWDLADVLRQRGPGCEMALAAFAAGCEPLALSVDRSLRQLPTEVAAQLILAPVWLAGRCAFGVDDDGVISAVRFGALEPPCEIDSGPVALLQSSFELVLRRAPTPAERLALELLSEGNAGQEHVRRLTRASVTAAARSMRRSGADPLRALTEICGEVPQNVGRTLEDWVAGVKPPARLRSAMFVELPDELTADRAAAQLGDAVVERLGSLRLAVDADAIGTLTKRLAAAGIELEAGIDRISGVWHERASLVDDRAARAWAPREHADWDTGLTPLNGTIVGILGAVTPAPEPVTSRPSQAVIELDIGGGPSDFDDFGTLFDSSDDLEDLHYVLEEVCGESAPVSVRYAAADGAKVIELVPTRVADGRVHGVDARTRRPVALWLTSILEVAA